MFSDTDIIKMLEFICNIYFYIGVGVFQDSRHFCGYQLCSSSCRIVPLFVRGRFDFIQELFMKSKSKGNASLMIIYI